MDETIILSKFIEFMENHSIKLYTGLSWNAAENESFLLWKMYAKTSLDYHKTN
jgi:hypothetical protein